MPYIVFPVPKAIYSGSVAGGSRYKDARRYIYPDNCPCSATMQSSGVFATWMWFENQWQTGSCILGPPGRNGWWNSCANQRVSLTGEWVCVAFRATWWWGSHRDHQQPHKQSHWDNFEHTTVSPTGNSVVSMVAMEHRIREGLVSWRDNLSCSSSHHGVPEHCYTGWCGWTAVYPHRTSWWSSMVSLYLQTQSLLG